MRRFVIALLVIFSGCTSGLFAEPAVEQADKAELLLLQDTLTKGARAQATYYVENGTYTFDVNQLDLEVPEGIAIGITQTGNQTYCMTGTHEELGEIWHVSTEETVPTPGGC